MKNTKLIFFLYLLFHIPKILYKNKIKNCFFSDNFIENIMSWKKNRNTQ